MLNVAERRALKHFLRMGIITINSEKRKEVFFAEVDNLANAIPFTEGFLEDLKNGGERVYDK